MSRVVRKGFVMQRGTLVLHVVACLWLASGCDASNPCGHNLQHVQGACIVATAPAVLDAGNTLDAAATTDAGCSEALDASLGIDCTKSSECGCAAPYCAVMPGQTVGVCTISGCTVTPDNCPTGYSCLDLSVFGVKDVAPFCGPKSS